MPRKPGAEPCLVERHHDGIHDEPGGKHEHNADEHVPENFMRLLYLARICRRSRVLDAGVGEHDGRKRSRKIHQKVDDILRKRHERAEIAVWPVAGNEGTGLRKQKRRRYREGDDKNSENPFHIVMIAQQSPWHLPRAGNAGAQVLPAPPYGRPNVSKLLPR